MNAAILIYKTKNIGIKGELVWVEPFSKRVLKRIPIGTSANLGLFPEQDCALVSFTDHSQRLSAEDWLAIYRISDWTLRARLPMNSRAHFNSSPRWSTFILSPDQNLIYIYKSRTLGNHLAEDYIGGLHLGRLAFTPWDFRLPECVAGWSRSGGGAHAQMLFVSDGVEVGYLPTTSFEQKVAFWLGPEKGMGPVISLGLRPRVHNDLGHVRAILFAPKRPLTVAVCNNGIAHLINPLNFRYLEQQQIKFTDGYAMPIFAAQIDQGGKVLYVGTALDEARHQGAIQHVVMHDLIQNRIASEWILDEPFVFMSLSNDGRYLCGLSRDPDGFWVLNAQTGKTEARMRLDGVPQYLVPST